MRALFLSRLKKTAISRIAIRETRVSRHHVSPVNGPSSHHTAIVWGDLSGALNWDPIMPRDAVSLGQRMYFFLGLILYNRQTYSLGNDVIAVTGIFHPGCFHHEY